MLTAAPSFLDRRKVQYRPYGEARDFIACKDREVLYEGPAGTGKSYACLWKVHMAMLKYPGARALMVRKTGASLTASGLVTFRRGILETGAYGVTFFGGSKADPAEFRYPNGSRIIVGGMDTPTKIMSAEYDLAYVQEATEISENDWEHITTRLRFGVMPYQQLIADCNPAAPTHWLNQRCNLGLTTRFGSRHEDNPTLYDRATGTWTEFGRNYMAILDALTGVRKDRLRYGKWVAAEGQVYESWNPKVHVVKREDYADVLSQAWHFGTADWGYTNAGVLQAWAVDYDGRLFLDREWYMTRKSVEGWWIPRAVQLSNDLDIREWVCDPSEPAFIAQFNAAGLNATQATNDILPGIGAVQNRLSGPNGTRLFILEDALMERDELLVNLKQPWATVQEIPQYVWAKNVGGETLKDKPVDAFNHGLDALRYAVAHLDLDGAGGEIDPALLLAFSGMPR